MRCRNLVTVIAVALLAAGYSEAREWRVELNGSGDFTDIQPAVEAAAPGDTIRIGPGRFDTFHPSCIAPAWTEDAIVTVVQDNLTFIGSGTDLTILGRDEYYWSPAADPKGFCSIDGNSAVIKDLTIENTEQAIYWWRGGLVVENCILRGGHSSFRGIIASVDRGNVRDCRFEFSGGGTGLSCASMDSLDISNCVFEGFGRGFSTGAGAGLITVSDSEFNGNSFGVAYAFGAHGSMRNLIMTNTVGQAIQILFNILPITIDNVHIDGGIQGILIDGGNGGPVYGESLIIENTTTEAIAVGVGAPVIINNSHILPASGIGVRCAGFFGDFQYLDFTGNYWGTTDPDSIAAMITDNADDPTLQVTVQFEPFANGPVPTEKKSLGSLKAMYR